MPNTIEEADWTHLLNQMHEQKNQPKVLFYIYLSKIEYETERTQEPPIASYYDLLRFLE